MTRFTVLLSVAALVLAIAAMSAGGSGVRDVVDDVIAPDLTDEVEDLVARSLSEYSGLERTPSPPAPVPVDRIPTEATSGVPTGIPPFVEIPLVIGAGHTPLVDLDALYGLHGYYGAPPGGAGAARCGGAADDRRHAASGGLGRSALGRKVVAEVLIGAVALVAAALLVWGTARCVLWLFLRR